jgi:hypothetical protein
MAKPTATNIGEGSDGVVNRSPNAEVLADGLVKKLFFTKRFTRDFLQSRGVKFSRPQFWGEKQDYENMSLFCGMPFETQASSRENGRNLYGIKGRVRLAV